MASTTSYHPLQYWLLFVSLFRAFSVYTGYRNPLLFQQRVFPQQPSQLTPLAGRLFAIWTLLTCTLCIVTALYINERGIFIVTYLSFIFALIFFTLELVIYRTMYVQNIIPMVVIAGTSLVWMTLYYVQSPVLHHSTTGSVLHALKDSL